MYTIVYNARQHMVGPYAQEILSASLHEDILLLWTLCIAGNAMLVFLN